LIFYIAIIVVLGFISFYHIAAAPKGLSQAEASSRDTSLSLRSIANNPINAPHKLVIWVAHKLSFDSYSALRFSSVLFGLLFGLCFYVLARVWFGKTVGLLSTAVFLSTPLFIIAARQASAEVMWFAPVLLMTVYSWLLRTKKHKKLAWLCLMVAAGLFVYTPGLIWWLAGALLVSWSKLRAIIATIPRQFVIVGIALLVLLLIPAIVASVKDWHIARELALLPAHWQSPLSVLKHIAWMPIALAIRAPFHTSLIISRLPVLDIIQIALLVFGLYAMWTAAKNKARILILSICFSIVAAGINNDSSLLILSLPGIAVFIAAGLRYLYIEWRSVFPNNPIPKSLALALMTCLVLIHVTFGLTYSLIAWSHTVATKHTYVLK
jgi:4-amino-4-deoxy-L-arabinose transferase-like glycosyltransferase